MPARSKLARDHPGQHTLPLGHFSLWEPFYQHHDDSRKLEIKLLNGNVPELDHIESVHWKF